MKKRGEHRLNRQLFRRRYVVVYNYRHDSPGWWRMSWPTGQNKRERI